MLKKRYFVFVFLGLCSLFFVFQNLLRTNEPAAAWVNKVVDKQQQSQENKTLRTAGAHHKQQKLELKELETEVIATATKSSKESSFTESKEREQEQKQQQQEEIEQLKAKVKKLDKENHDLVLVHSQSQSQLILLEQQRLQDQQDQEQAPAIPASITTIVATDTVAPKPKSSTLKSLAEQALQALLGRKHAYIEQGRLLSHWKLRGIGHLYSRRNILLAASIPQEITTSTKGGASSRTIRIDNVLPELVEKDYKPPPTTTNDCSLLTIWVRVNGPEIFAGSAVAVLDESSSKCHWEFAFDLRVPGDYQVDIKLLVWNGNAPVRFVKSGKTESQCDTYPGGAEVIDDNNGTIAHGGFLGFKLYDAPRACCEICTRLAPYCTAWATPPKNFPEASRFRNGCELYFDNEDLNPEYIPSGGITGLVTGEEATTNHTTTTRRRQQLRRGRRRLEELKRYHGKPAATNASQEGGAAAYFLGCGWSYWFTLDFPCVSGDLDDRVFTDRSQFTFRPIGNDEEEKDNDKITTADSMLRPMCTNDHEKTGNHKGRWIRQSWPNATVCPQTPMTFTNTLFEVLVWDPERPHCWHRDDLNRVGNSCMEMNCALLKTYNSTWISPLHKETQWFGYWQHDDCDYLEFTDAQLQQCVTERKISAIKHEGASINSSIQQYVKSRKDNITFYDDNLPDAMDVTLSTLNLLHMQTNSNELEAAFRKRPNSTQAHEYYWASSFYQSSERDVWTHVEHEHAKSNLAEDILNGPLKGYTMLNSFDTTAAFTYDTATQMDGMHIIGPPMKMLVTKFFHHMCRGRGGTRVGTYGIL